MPDSLAPPAACRVVLDSNVWIDILVFDDPATRPIRAALERGTLVALIDARCLYELERVLDYPQFRARAVDKAAALATVARLARPVDPRPGGDVAPALPKCKDRDDQKFLELAHAAQAEWLVSKDRALLKLARRTARDFGFRIAEPAPFAAAACASADAADTTTPASTPASTPA
ncbi:putative toxin-antitoxin system toxin component, PIN family [Burkholderia guangdongensis]|uniref:putative toxin-antitoxin system toxin component, PIN family n=1 Tax=Burkholderia guangdongensis TaxID=1792500 RepID=UPI0015CAE903|nr:putative toxin-antitoxin system toxin component, PIN family [Burkholderia guangdongensis]